MLIPFPRTRACPLPRLPLMIAAVLAAYSPASPQDRSLVTPDDYGRWENLGPATLSPDGTWIAYTVTRVDEHSELRLRRLAEDSTRVFPWGASPTFSPDGRWFAWTTGVSPDEEERLGEADEPVRRTASVLDLHTGDTREFDAVAQLALGAGTATGDATTFGNVGEMAWSPAAPLLAMAISTGTDVGNGVQIFNAAACTLRSADASGSRYRSLSWRDDSADLAVLRSRDEASAEGTGYDVLAWRELDRRVEVAILGADTPGIPDSLEVVRHRAPRLVG